MAIGSLAAWESGRASDSVTGMVATITAAMGSFVVFLSGLQAWIVRRRVVRRPASG